jgi:enoyl-CoA hydratase/carnithine racemase
LEGFMPADETKETPVETWEPPMADPGVTPELMTAELRAVFSLKERARILIANGSLTADQAFERGLVSQADAAQMKLLTREQLLSQPLAVLEAPTAPLKRANSRCC